jgi:hypothetical protein
MTTRTDKNIQFSEYAGHFFDQVNNADKLRVESLQRLHKIRSKRQKNQQRQLKRLATKFGEKHPRVLLQAERIVNEKEMENYLSIAISKADVEVESIKDSFILQGRVLADDIKGLSGFQVQLLDARNNVIGKPVKTDKKGFYKFVIDVDESFKSKKVNVVVLDKQGTQIHKEKLPVLVRADVIESRDIVIARVDKFSRDKNVLLNEVLKTSKPLVRKKVVRKKDSARAKSVRKVVKKSKARKAGNKKP